MSNSLQLSRAHTIPNLIDDYVSTALVGVSTLRIRDVKNTLMRWAAYMGGRSMVPMEIAKYPEFLIKKGVHPNSVNNACRILRSFFRWAFRMGLATERWYEYVGSVRGVAYAEPKIITQTEYEKLLSISDDIDLSWGIVCGYHTGLRLGDVCNLRWSCVDMDRQLVKTTPSKTSRAHAISVEIPFVTESDMHRWLRDLKEQDEAIEGYVSYSLHTRYAVDKTCISRYYTRLFRKAGIPDKSFKQFRSTFESRLANSGINLGMAAKMTGRSDPRSLMRYIKVDIEAAREGVAKAMEIHNKLEIFK